jgi:conjugative relaxase-like TrwC/TraI family protein
MLRGQSPDGEAQWAAPLLRVDPRGTVPGVELARILVAAGLDEGALDDRMLERWHRVRRAASRAVQGSGRPDPRVPADVAELLCRAAGVDPTEHFADFAGALEFAGERVDRRLPGLDLTFSAPKSVSIVYALGSPDVAKSIRAGHEAAVAEAMRYLESVAGHALRGHQGDGREARRVESEGFIAAAFEHRSNRCGDMQLHTHVVVANMLRDPDGRVSALDSRELYRQARTAGYLYQAVLRHELTNQLGVNWEQVRRGSAEIRGVPWDVRRAFSKRRQQIEAALLAFGRSDREAAHRATLTTRPAKPAAKAPETLRERWAVEARQHGFDPARVPELLGRTSATALVVERRAAIGNALVSATGLTEQHSTFDRRDVIQATCEQLPCGGTTTEIAGTVEEFMRRPDVVPVAARDRRYSTVDLLTVEQQTLAAIETGWAVPPPLADTGIPATSAEAGLNAGQREAVRRLVNDISAVSVLIGPAGCGKTSALRVAHRQWRAAGLTVVGSSVAASVARQLETETGIPSTSLTLLIADANRPDEASAHSAGLPQHSVVVIDEAGMVGTRDLARLVDLARESASRLVLVGDPFQLPAVEAGGMLAALANRPGTIVLSENVRQVEDWERDALDDMRLGNVSRTLARLAEHGRLHVADEAADARDAMLDAWFAARADGRRAVMIAPRRSQCFTLNQLARVRMRETGQLGAIEVYADDHDLGPRTFAVGDVVVVTKNAYAEGLLNGTRGTVIGLDRDGWLSIEDPEGLSHRVSASHVADRLDHAYAVTCHKAQGLTVDVGLLMIAGRVGREAAYVGLSRGRNRNHAFAVTDDLAVFREDKASRETDDLPEDRGDSPTPEPAHHPKVAQVSMRMQASEAKSIASRDAGADMDDLRRRRRVNPSRDGVT